MSGDISHKICDRCGLDMQRVGGFTLASDFNEFMRGERTTIREFCTGCILKMNGQFPVPATDE